MSRAVRRALAALALAGAGAAPARAQGVPLDRIVAVVGSTPILYSQVEERVVELQAQGQKLPPDSAGRMALRRQVLDQMVNEELMIQKAARDTSIRVTEQEVQDEVDKQVKTVKSQITDPQDFERQLHAAGFATEEEWRRHLADEQRRTITIQRLLDELRQKGTLKPIPPTDQQLRDAWEATKGQAEARPASVTFRQIVIASRPDSAARAAALHLADSLRTALQQGADFADLARRFSGDSSTRAAGGELGWFRRGVMVKPFEDVAFRLKPGELSPVVETQFGFHIIQVERVQPAEIDARHILIVPTVSAAQVARARASADSVYHALVAGAPFDTLAARYQDPDEPKLADNVPITQLPPEYQTLLAADSTTGWKAPIEIQTGTGRPKFAVVDVTVRRAAGEYTFDDVRDQLRDQVSQNLGIQHYLDQLRRSTYISIRL